MCVLKLLEKIDKKCEQYRELLILLLIVIVLRIPNFFEPYWYGDEAIYLTVGTGLRNGLRLYTDIIDHKTPLIYYLAMVPTQFYFRLLNLGWMMVSTWVFFNVANTFFGRTKKAFLASLIFVLLTTLPWLEGHIPNGELFVMGFVLVGFWLLGKTQWLQGFLKQDKHAVFELSNKEIRWLVAAGIFFGLGILTKVPAVLDFGAALLIGWFPLATMLVAARRNRTTLLTAATQFLKKAGFMAAGVAIPIGLSVLYFVLRGSGRDYLEYGLLYNLRYSGSWQLTFNNPLLEFLFTFPGKTLVLGGIIAVLSFVKKWTPRFQFAAGWFALTLFGALLSNRPYPHYLLQTIPALALLLPELLGALRKAVRAKTMIATGALLLLGTIGIIHLLNVRPYSAGEYYGKFYKLLTRQMTMEEYDASFNSFVADNYEAAEIIKGLNGHKIFIWGTNPMLYALTQTVPTSRFTVAFHIKDFQDYERTFAQIEEEKPKIIVVMKNETDPFPQLEAHLNAAYYPNTQFEHMTLYLLQEPPDRL